MDQSAVENDPPGCPRTDDRHPGRLAACGRCPAATAARPVVVAPRRWRGVATVNAEPGCLKDVDTARFVLVVTNPRLGQSPNATTALDAAQRLLDKGRVLGTDNHTHTEASFLFTWIALETVMKALRRSDTSKKTVPIDGWTLVRDAAIAGQIDRRDIHELDRFKAFRNSLVHGGDVPELHKKDVATLRTIVNKILREAHQR